MLTSFPRLEFFRNSPANVDRISNVAKIGIYLNFFCQYFSEILLSPLPVEFPANEDDFGDTEGGQQQTDEALG